MDETLNVLTDTQDQVVDGQEPSVELTDGVESATEEVAAPPADVEQTPQTQSHEDNALAKAARIRAEQETEARLAKQFNDNIASMGLVNPFTNAPILTIDDMAAYKEANEQAQLQEQAEKSGVPLEKLQAELEEKQQKEREIEALRLENETLKQKEFNRVLSDDLSDLQKDYPELAKVKDVKEIGDTFIKLRAADVDLRTAYEAARAEKERNTKPTPPKMGAVNTSTSTEKDFYTPEEVDMLTDADYEKDPKLMQKVRNSMPKWKRT